MAGPRTCKPACHPSTTPQDPDFADLDAAWTSVALEAERPQPLTAEAESEGSALGPPQPTPCGPHSRGEERCSTDENVSDNTAPFADHSWFQKCVWQHIDRRRSALKAFWLRCSASGPPPQTIKTQQHEICLNCGKRANQEKQHEVRARPARTT